MNTKIETKVTDYRKLINYLDETYFELKGVPKNLQFLMKNISKKVPYLDMLGCFKLMEESIKALIVNKIFADSNGLGKYIFVVMQNSLGKYESVKKQKELEAKHELYQLDNDNTIFIDRSKYKGTQIESVNYDILD